MLFSPPLTQGVVLRRYKRFLVDVSLENGEQITAHCPNSGSMKNCMAPGYRCALSYHPNPTRKLPWTLEMTHNGICWICVNTHRANAQVHEALIQRQILELASYSKIRPEAPLPSKSRIDFLLEERGLPSCYLEVKSVSLVMENKYMFPDSVTERGQKHLRELMALKEQGYRAVMLFLIQRSDGIQFAPADAIDPSYGKLLRQASLAGVEILAWKSQVNLESLSWGAPEVIIL